jgi:hypothetical protein
LGPPWMASPPLAASAVPLAAQRRQEGGRCRFLQGKPWMLRRWRDTGSRRRRRRGCLQGGSFRERRNLPKESGRLHWHCGRGCRFARCGQSRPKGHRGGRARLSRLLGCLHTRVDKGTTREQQETAGTLLSDHPGDGWEQAYHTRDGEDAGGCYATPPARVGAFGTIYRNHVLGNVGSNGLLPGSKAGEQHIRTQHVQDARIPARMPSNVPHSPWCEDRAFSSPGLLQTMTDVGQALTVGERLQRHASYRLLFEWPQWRGREMAPEGRKTHQKHYERGYIGHVAFVTNRFPGRAEDGVPRAADKTIGSGTNLPFEGKIRPWGFGNQQGGM